MLPACQMPGAVEVLYVLSEVIVLATPMQPGKKIFCKSCTIKTPPLHNLQIVGVAVSIQPRNRPAKQVRDLRWLNQHSLNQGFGSYIWLGVLCPPVRKA